MSYWGGAKGICMIYRGRPFDLRGSGPRNPMAICMPVGSIVRNSNSI